MKTVKIKNLLAIMLISVSLFSCSSDDDGDNGTIKGSKYVIGYLTDTWDANYMWGFDSLDEFMTGTIDMTGKGIEQAGSYLPVANSMLALSTDVEGSTPYYLNNLSQLIAGNYVFIESIYAYGVSDDEKVVIVGASWDGSSTDNELIIYDPTKQAITARKFDNFATTGEFSDFPTAATVSNGKLYVSVFSRKKAWTQPGGTAQDKAWIRVYDYPSLTFVKRIEDTRTTSAGMYYTGTGIVRTDSGNVYSFSSNSHAAGFDTLEATKKSGILRINKGTTEFDSSYFFDIESSSLKGKVLAAYPVGGEKVFINYILEGADDVLWGFLFDNYKFKSAIIDLSTKTITPVTGLPAHGGDYYFGVGSLYVEDGNAYKAFKTADEVRIYRINVSTGTATAGAKVVGGGTDISAITKLSPR